MKQSKVKKIGAIVIIVIIIFMFAWVSTSVVACIMYKFNIKNPVIEFMAKKTNIENEDKKIDWNEKYPVKSEDNSEIQEVKLEKVINVINKMNEVKEKIRAKTSEGLGGYEKLLEISYLYDKAIGYQLVSNNNIDSRIKVGEYLCKLEAVPTNFNNQMEEKANILVNLNNYLKKRNVNLLYVQAPSKIEKNNDYISPIYIDAINKNIDILIDGIKDKVDYIDLREIIEQKGEDYLNLFFKTDHHWKPETGLWATGKIVDRLREKYNYNINNEIYDINNYNIEKYESIFLGSDGRYMTLANAKKEDLSVLTPKFDTELYVSVPEKEIEENGTFQDTLIDYSQLNFKANKIEEFLGIKAYREQMYSTYMYNDTSLVEIHNKKATNNNKILIIKDSFGRNVAPYLALGVEYCFVVDLRCFNGSILSYIEEYNPDVVIVIYYPGTRGRERSMVI